jgi:hypothetical protein
MTAFHPGHNNKLLCSLPHIVNPSAASITVLHSKLATGAAILQAQKPSVVSIGPTSTYTTVIAKGACRGIATPIS